MSTDEVPAPAESHDDLLERVIDEDLMLEVLRRELPRWTDVSIRVAGCRPKLIESRRVLHRKQLRISYKVQIAAADDGPREFLLLGTVPVSAAFLGGELLDRCHALKGHPAISPFRQAAAYLDDLQMAIQLFPVDLALPGLAEITGPRGRQLLEPHLPECGAGGTIDQIEGAVTHRRNYKPGKRCVLRFKARGTSPSVGPFERTLIVKIFGDERGEIAFQRMEDLWRAAFGSGLRVPEPLGYDPALRMLVMAEAPGEKEMSKWVKCLEKGRPLPAGVDLDRLDRCMVATAGALHALQGLDLEPPVQRRFRDDLDLLRADRDHLLEARPGLIEPVDRALSRLEAHPFDDSVLLPAHGAFRHTQILGDESCQTIFDWDGISLAHPAADAATFLARLRQEPIRRPGTAPIMSHLAATFRREFLKRQPEVRGREIALYESLRLIDKALRSFRRPGPEEEVWREGAPFLSGAEKTPDALDADSDI